MAIFKNIRKQLTQTKIRHRANIPPSSSEIAAVSCVISLVIPVMIRRMGFFRNLTWIYAAIGIVGLGIVCIAGSTSYGAKISFTIAGITVQPSEFIKILFVFFVAAMYHKSTEFRQAVITTLIAALHVLILVLSR